jgi:hypothetical protein
VEKVKNGLMNSYSRTNSSSSLKGAESELSQMKLRKTKTAASSGWRLDPFKERGVSAVPVKSTAKRKKKSSLMVLAYTHLQQDNSIRLKGYLQCFN